MTNFSEEIKGQIITAMNAAIGDGGTDSPRDTKRTLLSQIKKRFESQPTEENLNLFVRTAKIKRRSLDIRDPTSFKIFRDSLDVKTQNAVTQALKQEKFNSIEEANTAVNPQAYESAASVVAASSQEERANKIRQTVEALGPFDESINEEKQQQLKSAYKDYLTSNFGGQNHRAVFPANPIEAFFNAERDKLLNFKACYNFLSSPVTSEFKKNLKNAQEKSLYDQYEAVTKLYSQYERLMTSATQERNSSLSAENEEVESNDSDRSSFTAPVQATQDNTTEANKFLVQALYKIHYGDYKHLSEKYEKFFTSEGYKGRYSNAMQVAINNLSNFKNERDVKRDILTEIKKEFDKSTDPTTQMHLIKLFENYAGAHRREPFFSIFSSRGPTSSLAAFNKELAKMTFSHRDIEPIKQKTSPPQPPL
jgi:hypothetical protein